MEASTSSSFVSRKYKYGFYIPCLALADAEHDRRAGLEELQRRLRAVEPYVVFKREHVVRALGLLGRIRPRPSAEEFLGWAREADSFAALNYSDTKRITAGDVEQHLRSMGFSIPVTTSSVSLTEEMQRTAQVSMTDANLDVA